MPCKIAVLRQATERSPIGDCIEAFDISAYLGDAVEHVGGMYVIIEVSDCEKDNDEVVKLTSEWLVKNPEWLSGDTSSNEYIRHSTLNRQYHLQPVTQGDEFFTELVTVGWVTVTLSKLTEYIRDRNG